MMEDGRGFDVRRMMEDVRCCHPDSCLLSISFIYALIILSKEIRNLGVFYVRRKRTSMSDV